MCVGGILFNIMTTLSHIHQKKKRGGQAYPTLWRLIRRQYNHYRHGDDVWKEGTAEWEKIIFSVLLIGFHSMPYILAYCATSVVILLVGVVAKFTLHQLP